MKADVQAVLAMLHSLADPKAVEEMAHFGITPKKALGLSTPAIRNLSKRIGKNHELALGLWKTGIFDARALAVLVDEAEKVTRKQMEDWVRDFDNWAICDACCGNLFDKTPFAYDAAVKWSKRTEEFVRRAGFTMMAELAVHDKKAGDRAFTKFFPHILRGASDDRNFVKKSVNWALRQIGKRNLRLNKEAVALARKVHALGSGSARWIASDALRELRSPAVVKRLKKRSFSRIPGI